MALQKQSANIPFGQGLDTKTDPNQVAAGKMLALNNAIFDKGGLLQKRNGFGLYTTLPNTNQTTLTTLNNNLIGTGSSLYAYSADTATWLNKGTITPVSINTQSIIRNNNAQIACDSTVAANGLVCAVYIDGAAASYQINDSSTGQIIVNNTALPANTVSPRVFLLGAYFIITYVKTGHLAYIAIPTSTPGSPIAPVDISTSISGTSAGYDGAVGSNQLVLAWDGSDGGGAIRVASLSSHLAISTTIITTGTVVTLASVIWDSTNSVFWTTWLDNAGALFTKAYFVNLTVALAKTTIATGLSTATNLTSAQLSGVLQIVIGNKDTTSGLPSDNVQLYNCTIGGSHGGGGIISWGSVLFSKAFTQSGILYYWCTSGLTLQPTYYLYTSAGNIIAKLAYSNGIGYPTTQVLSSVNTNAAGAYLMAYEFKDLIAPINKTQGGVVTGGTAVNGIYTQTGVNICTFSINASQQYSAEIANSLHLTGGLLWQYDDTQIVEHGWHVFPDGATNSATATTGGNMAAQIYYYQFTYEWTDASGKIHRSAPSVPLVVDLHASGTATNTATLKIPAPMLTAKTNMRIGVYRWSTGQQTYYSVYTPPLYPPVANNTVTLVTITDTAADSTILGNTIIYTNGGVLENIGAPSFAFSTLWKNRYWGLDSEDRNLWWFSKLVVEGTPVEMTDLQTYFVAPTASSNQSTGPVTAGSSMDDKLISFKKDTLYYTTGDGPDITGANNDYGEPVLITSSVGCTNQASIISTPLGLMFQSPTKGIWMLERNLNTKYIGAPVAQYNNDIVLSSILAPGTNQVRFTMASGAILMYDYYYDQWGTFSGVPSLSSTIYNGEHTLLNKYGLVLQETPGAYIDNTAPVLMSYTTAWLKLTGLQGFQRAYYFTMLAQYLSPHTLAFSIAYDYNPTALQIAQVTPTNMNTTWGSDTLWGSGPYWGGSSSVEQWRIFLNTQKCQAVQITMQESFDASQGTAPGAGLTISGLNVTFGAKQDRVKTNLQGSTS